MSLSGGVAAFCALLGFAVLVSLAAERVRIPAAVLLVATGAAAGSIGHLRPPFDFGPALFFVFLPPLVFEAAWSIDLAALRRCAWRVAVLAGPGTVLSACVVAAVVAATGTLAFAPAFLLGAIISATDPVAVVAVFRQVAVPTAVRTLVEAESLSNDGVAVVLYGTALALAQHLAVAWPAAFSHALLAIGGGIALGTACAAVWWLVLRGTRSAQHEVTGTVVLAFTAYLLADWLGLSGIFSTAAAAVALRGLGRRAFPLANRDAVDQHWASGAFIANAVVFLAAGLMIDIPRALHEPLLIGGAIAGALLARAVLAWGAGAGAPARITVFLAGMRGALPLALALALPPGLPMRAELIDAVFAVVLVTLVLGGLALRPVAFRLFGGVSG